MLGVRAATKEEIEWIKVQLNPAQYYVDKFMELNKQFGAIDLDGPTIASRLATSLKRLITEQKLKILVYREASSKTVLLARDDWEEENDE